MKKFSAIIIALLYLAVSSGLLVQVHHCMGRIAGVSLLQSTHDDTCNTCGMEKGNGLCCKDELKLVKLQDEHQLKYAEYKLAVPEIAIQSQRVITDFDLYRAATHLQPDNHSPPRSPDISLCVLYCVFRI